MAWEPIAIPSDTTSSALEIVTKARKVVTVLTAFSTEQKMQEADRELAIIASAAQRLRLDIRKALKDRREADRIAAAEKAEAEARNAEISAQRRAGHG